MGIDIYAKWRDQTEAEKSDQITGYSVVAGGLGYLRETYHGEPYATRYLVKEAFESEKGEAKIPAKRLRERLPETIKLVIKRHRIVYNEKVTKKSPKVKSYIRFVELCEKMEKRNGEPTTIVASY